MPYKVIIPKRVEKTILKLDSKIQQKIIKKLKQISSNPFQSSLDLRPMQEIKHTYRLRIGKIRILMDIFQDKKEIHMLKIGFRGDVYKR